MANNKIVTADRLEYFKGRLSNVAISGNYNDLNNKPVVPDISTILNVVYPIGSIYISVNNTSPSTLFGGTWEKI